MSVWSPPSAQQYPAQPSTAVDALMNRIRKLEGLIAELTKGSPLRQAGMGVSPGQVDFDGDVVIGGRIFTTGDAEFSGNTTIGGNARITGTLSLPAGIIDNDALANPLAFAADSADANVFPIPKTEVTVVSRTITVPPGFTTAVVQGFGTIYAMNSTATLDYLYACVFIDWPAGSTSGRQLLTPLTANNGSGHLAVNKQTEITGLSPGDRITVRMTVKSAFANLPATANNGSSINLLVIWAR